MGTSQREELEDDRDYTRFICHLLKTEPIDDDRAQGIAKQVVCEGPQSLSKKQNYVYKKHVEPLIPTNCGQCGRSLEVYDLIEIYEGSVCVDCNASEKSWPA